MLRFRAKRHLKGKLQTSKLFNGEGYIKLFIAATNALISFSMVTHAQAVLFLQK